MQGLASEGSKDASVRDAAVSIVQGAGVFGHDYPAQLAALFRFVRDRILFINDPIGVQVIQSPRKTLELGAGNCVQRASLLVALARSIGIPAALKFRVIASDPRRRRTFSHVYVVATLKGRSIPLDPTYSTNRVGWEFSNPFRRAEVPA